MQDKVREVLIVVIFTILIIIFGSALMFWAGYLDGIIINWLFGGWVVKALALIHINIDRSQIPLLFGLIGLISSFFKTYVSYRKDKD